MTPNPTADSAAESSAQSSATRRRRTFQVAWPLLAGASSTLAMTTADTAILGQFATREQATMAHAGVLYVAVAAICSPLAGSLQILAAQHWGARDSAAVRRLLPLGLRLAAAVGVAVALVLGLAAAALVRLSDQGAGTGHQDEIVTTSRILLLGLPFALVATAARSWVSAQGLTRMAMVATLIANVANIAFDLLLVFGLRLGAPGSAMGTVAGTALGAGYAVAKASSVRRTLSQRDPGDAVLLRPLWGIAWPDMVFGAAAYGTDLLIMVTVTSLGADELAGFRVLGTTVAVLFIVAFTCANAITILAGQQFGAGAPAQARGYLRAGAAVMSAAVAVVAVPLLFAPAAWARLFTADPAVLHALAQPLRLFWVIVPAMVASLSLAGFVRAAGDTRSMMYIGILAQAGVALPTAWFLGVRAGWGLQGIVAGMACGWCLRLGLTAWRAARIVGPPAPRVMGARAPSPPQRSNP